MLSQVIDLIEKNNRFAITSHIRPDGDSLGSSLALCWILKGLKKDAEVVMCDNVPHAYAKLPGADEVGRASGGGRELAASRGVAARSDAYLERQRPLYGEMGPPS